MASAHTTPEKSLASEYAHSQRAQAGRDSRMKKDACYELYAAALKCLDENNYSHEQCADAFQAFRDCRTAQEEAASLMRMKAQEDDPIMGWVFRRWNAWRASSAQEEHAAEAAEAAAAAAAASSGQQEAAAAAGGGEAAAAEGDEQQGWRPPPGEPPRKWEWTPPPPPRRKQQDS